MAQGVLERHLQYADITSSAHTTAIVSAVAFLLFVYQLLVYLGLPLLSPLELLWNVIVYLCPASWILDNQPDESSPSNMLSQTHAAKSEALRNILGTGSAKVLQSMPGTGGVMRRASLFSTARETTSDAPPGLGNWDNSCYQNSVLQGLSSLDSLRKYLGRVEGFGEDDANTTSASLRETTLKLNDAANNGRHLWTPAKLKSMSSWQQQDAQEYFSKIMDELDKEASKVAKMKHLNAGLKSALEPTSQDAEPVEEEVKEAENLSNPLEGLIAQRVACTSCGFSEGLSMIPFNCLTVPLGSEFRYSIEQCLDGYTELEDITEVECSKCTLLRAEDQLKHLVGPKQQEQESEEGAQSSVMSLPPELRAQIAARLASVQKALEDDDFADKTLYETCQISKKSRVSSTKTRQAVIARGPQSLVLHVNRSVFDELTGVQRKNYASVRYPMLLNLDPWTLQTNYSADLDKSSPADKASLSLLREGNIDSGSRYILRAVVTHYGRHENGHYIAYRTHPKQPKPVEETVVDSDVHSEPNETGRPDDEDSKVQWWRLSDEDVSPVSAEDVLGQGGVFMLFYERVETARVHQPAPIPTDDITESMSIHPAITEAATTMENASEVAAIEESPLAFEETSASARAQSESIRSRDTSLTRSSVAGTIEDESDATDYEDVNVSAQTVRPVEKMPTPQWMRTAHGRQDSQDEGAFTNVMRPMAAT